MYVKVQFKKYLSQTIPAYLLPFYTNNLIYHVAFFAFGNQGTAPKTLSGSKMSLVLVIESVEF